MYWIYNDGTFTLHNKNSESAVVFEHLKMTDDGFLSVTSQTALTITGDFDQGSGSDKMVLKSDANGTASLIIYGTVSGLSKSEKFLDASHVYGYTIASPVQDAQNSTFAGHINTYFYNATVPGWQALNMSSGSLQIMRGYWTKFNGDKTIEFSGMFNTGDISFTDLYRISPYGFGNMGWNFLGNPYPSAIDWNEVIELNGTATNFIAQTKLNNATYVLQNNGAYGAYVGGIGTNGFNGIIPANTGFWVQVNKDYYDAGAPNLPVDGAKLDLNNSVRVHDNLSSGTKESNHFGLIRLFVQMEDVDDEVIIRLLNNASLDFDPDFDAFKMFAEGNSIPQIYMRLPNNNQLVINTLPEDITLPHLVPLGIKSTANKAHKIRIDLDNFAFNQIGIHLEDKVTGAFTDMRSNNSYSYNALSNDEDQRFVLHLGALTGLANDAPSALQIYAHNNTVYITGLEEHIVFSLYNMLGQEIQRMHLEPGSHVISADVVTGPYIVRIAGSRKMETKKIYIETLN